MTGVAAGGGLPPAPPEDTCEQKMEQGVTANLFLTMRCGGRGAVQAGTPMTVTGNGTLPLSGQGVLLRKTTVIFCSEVSSGVSGGADSPPSLATRAPVQA